MRVAFLVDHFPVLSETFILHQITGTIERGHDVDIYPNKVGNLDKMHSEVESYHLLESTFYPQVPANYFGRGVDALKIIFANSPSKLGVLLQCLNFFKYGRKAASLKLLYSASRFMEKPTYDIIHCQLGYIGLQGLLLRDIGALKGKLIVSFRGADLSLYLRMFGERLYERLFARADLFLPVCEDMKRRLIELGCDEKKVVVHRSGLDFESFVFTGRRRESSKERVRLVTVARLVEKKGVEYGIKAVVHLAKSHPRLEYSIVGDGPLREDLQRLLIELDLESAVKLLGWKEKQEIIEILKDADILVAPSVTSRDGDREGIPNVLKEAMAMGLPVVSTQHSGIPELVQDGVSGFLVPERDVDALAEKLEYLIAHPERWPEMGRAGRAYIEECYDINKLNDRLVEIYQQLISPQLP